MNKRPLLLSSALVLSSVGSGLAAVMYFAAFLFYEKALPSIEKFTNAETPELISRFYMLALGSIYCVSAIGIVKMWNTQKTGFYLYLLAQISLWGLPLIYIGSHAFSSTNTIFTLLFIAIYSLFLKRMA